MATATNSVALGAGSTTTANLSAAAYNPGASVSSGVATAANGEVSVGSAGAERRITNVAAGSAATDAVNVSQLKSEDAKVSMGGTTTATALGGGSTYDTTTGAINAPTYTVQGQTTSDVGTALSKIDSATTKNTGDITTINSNINNLQKDSLQWNATAGAFDAKHGTSATNKIIDVEAGTLSATSKDAVNGSQLYGVASSVAKDLGGGASVNADGTVSAPSYVVQGATKSDVGSALSALDTATTKNAGDITTLNTTVNNISNGTVGLVQQDATSKAITVAGKTAGTTVDFTGTVGARQLKGVSRGTADTDAVNVAQLKAVGLSTDTSGNVTNAFVAYDSTTKDKVTLTGGATGTTLTNVKAGALSASSTDAMNGSQLFATNANVTTAQNTADAAKTAASTAQTTADAASTAAANAVQFSATGGNADVKNKRLVNVAAGTSDTDAVNIKQMKAAGLSTDMSGNVTNAFVAYDSTTKDKVTLGGGATGTTVTNVKAGALSASSMDAVNGSQLYATNQNVSNVTSTVTNITNGGGIKYFHTNSALADSTTKGADSIAVGGGASSDGKWGVALGTNSSATGDNSVALGNGSVADRANTVSVSNASALRQVVNMAKGTADTDAVNISQLKGVTGALGGGSAVNADGTIKAPTYTVQGQTATDVGTALSKIDGATTKNAGDITTINANINGLQKDSLQWDAAAGSFSAKHGTSATNKIANVTAGTAATDAVNFGQLTAASTSEAAALGGGSTVNADGTITKPKYKVGGKDAVGVDGAVTALDGRIDGVAGDVSTITNNINNGTTGLVQQASKGAKLTVGKATDGSIVDFLGTAGARQLTNVAKGAVNATSVDAINGSQLYGTAQSAADAFGGGTTVDANGKVTKPKYSIGGTDYNNVGDALGAVQSTAAGTDEMAVKYDTAAKTQITLAGQDGTTLANVATGKADLDAVNVKQLKDAGVLDGDGNSVKAVLFNGLNGEANVAGKKIVNVAAGTAATDAVNFGQLTAASTSEAAALGGGSTVNADGTITKPKYKVGGKDAVGVDGAVTALDGRIDGVAGDVSTITNNINNGTTGLVQQASKGAKLTVGKATDGSIVDFLGTAGARQLTNVAKGAVNATSVDAINGSQLYGTAQSAVTALGGGSAVNADATIKAPTYTVQGQTATDVGTALSKIDSATTKNAGDITTINTNINGLQKDSLQWDATAGLFSAKHGVSATNKIANVTAGTAATDAVNFGQLTAASQAEADALGGGSTVDANGKVAKPKYKLDGSKTNADNVGDAITNLDGRTTDNSSAITNITNNISNGTVGLVQQASKGEKLTVGENTDGKEVNFIGTAGDRMLTGVAAGTVDNAAVNLGQLKGAVDGLGGGASIDPTTGAMTGPTYNVTNIDGTTTEVHNAGDAISTIDGRVTNIDGRVTNVEGDITNIMNGTSGLVQQAAAGEKLTVGKDTDGKEVNFTGTAGDRMLTGVAAGTVDNAAVNLGQFKAAVDGLGGGASIDPTTGAVTGPTYNVTNIDGTTTKVHNAGDAISTIDGRVTNIDSRVTENTTNISTINNTLNNITNGAGITYFHANSTLADSQALGMESVAIGGNAQSRAANSVALGSNSVADRANSVSVGAAGNERQITNVAAGTADTDAVNVAQLKASGIINPNGTTNTAVTYDKNPDGTTNYNSITMGSGVDGGTTIHNVAAGATGNDAVNVSQMNQAISSVTNMAQAANNPMFSADGNRDTEGAIASGSHATAMGANAKANAANSVAMGANSVADRDNAVSVGSSGNERQITNVANGTAATDAVNVGQMNDSIGAAVGNLPGGVTAKDYTDQQVKAVQSGVNQVARGAYSGVAAATALSMIPDVDLGKTIAVGVGTANYKGYQATAIGASVRVTQNLKAKLGAGISAAGTTIGAGASYQW
ncbi:YadA-like family protein [Paraburkholderia sp. BCC1876]|uniref:YadA-like family protein n=1 Tax=Paraburkholderia sp. BCC1876 TaxID=2676303 RepID=UPI001FC86B57|nr:YadA-like family protein [Paraburkholderia sp. BCC1876]